MDLEQDFELAALQARVDGIVDQFHDRIGGRTVVGKERGCDGRVDPLANGHTLSHVPWKSIPDSRFDFPIGPPWARLCFALSFCEDARDSPPPSIRPIRSRSLGPLEIELWLGLF